MKAKKHISRREALIGGFALATMAILPNEAEAKNKKRKKAKKKAPPSTYDNVKEGVKKRWNCAIKELPKTDPLTQGGLEHQQTFFPKCFPKETKVYGVVKKFFFSP